MGAIVNQTGESGGISHGQLSPKFIKAFYRRLIMAGFTPKEAGNLTASLLGLKSGKEGWKIKEIIDLLFLYEINDHIES